MFGLLERPQLVLDVGQGSPRAHMLAMRCPASLGKVPVAAERKFGQRRGMVDDGEQTAESLPAYRKSITGILHRCGNGLKNGILNSGRL